MPRLTKTPAAPPPSTAAETPEPAPSGDEVLEHPAKEATEMMQQAADTAKPVKVAGAIKKAAATKKPEPVYDDEPLSEEDDYINALYYGDAGSGKTTNVAFAANQGRVLMINAESGIKARRLKKLGVTIDNIMVRPNVQAGELLSFEMLENLYWRIKGELEKDPGCWYAVIWDSVTEIVKKLLDDVVAKAYKKAQAKGDDRSPFFIGLPDYGEMSEQVGLLLRRFRDLPCHFLVTALERRELDNDGAVAYFPAVNPALIGPLQGWMSMVLHTDVIDVDGKEEYRALSKSIGKFKGKDHYGVLPRYLVDPTFDRIHAYVFDELEVDDDPIMQEAKVLRIKLGTLKLEQAAKEGDAA